MAKQKKKKMAWQKNGMAKQRRKKWYGRAPGGMQTLARSWISRSFGPQARFWHSFDISFSESCFAIRSSSPQPNGARVQNCAGIFEDVNIWMWIDQQGISFLLSEWSGSQPVRRWKLCFGKSVQSLQFQRASQSRSEGTLFKQVEVRIKKKMQD